MGLLELEAVLAIKKERFIYDKSEKRGMHKKEVISAASGLSHLSYKQLKDYQGKCVGIVDGEAKFVNKNPVKVLEELKKVESNNKIFTCVPKGGVTLVK